MLSDPSSIPSTDLIQSPVSNRSKPVLNEKKQLSFVYQPGVGFYDKKRINLDQDLNAMSTTDNIDQLTSDVNHQESSSPPNLYKLYLRRQNEQDSLPIRQKLHRSDEILSDKNQHIQLLDDNISTNQENHQKRKIDQNLISNKKSRQSSSTDKQKSTENYKPDDQEVNTIITEQQSLPIKPQTKSNERPQKHASIPIIKSIPIVKKLSSDNRKPDTISTEQEVQSIPSQGLLLCPKEEPIKKKKKKKITSTSTALLDDDSVLDSILFNEIQSVQQQWQQFLILSMEKELHINPSDGKKKLKINKFNRSNEFLLAYENLYDFEGMKHWCPTSR